MRCRYHVDGEHTADLAVLKRWCRGRTADHQHTLLGVAAAVAEKRCRIERCLDRPLRFDVEFMLALLPGFGGSAGARPPPARLRLSREEAARTGCRRSCPSTRPYLTVIRV